MEHEEFREFGKAAIDYIADYNESLRERRVLPSVRPGYLRELLPDRAPDRPDTWRQIIADLDRHIMPGVTHWNSPHFHAYYPTANSYPAIVGEILCAGLGGLGLSWAASPASAELEMITMDWLAKLLGLPEHFLNARPGPGGGVLQGSASESTLVALIAARELTVARVKREQPSRDEAEIRAKLVAYSSDQSNSSVEKGGRLASVSMRLLPGDERGGLRGVRLLAQLRADLVAGLVPCCVVATLGTTATCGFDRLDELGPLCAEHKLWLHVDAAYAGAAFVCPEYRHLMAGVEYVDSFSFNPHKWLLVSTDCSAFWVKDSRHFSEEFNIERVHMEENSHGPARYCNRWQMSASRRFRSLKLWFVLRLYGAEGLRKHIRHAIGLAKRFADLLAGDANFEIPVEVNMGLVCFRLKGEDGLTRQLLDRLMASRLIYVIPGSYRGKLVIRFVVCSRFAMQEDIDFAWREISGKAAEVFRASAQRATSVIRELEAPARKMDEIAARVKDFKKNNDLLMAMRL